MHVEEAIRKRLSIRRYAETSIPDKHLKTLLLALQLAPSANNFQNWEFIFVGDPELKHKLIPACFNQKFVSNCAYFIAGIADPALKWHMVDIAIALTNFTLQATELGYGTCWIGAFDESSVKEILGVSREKKVVICMTFGMSEGKHVHRRRKAVKDFVSLNYYNRRWDGSVI